jgi:hypothetical protein
VKKEDGVLFRAGHYYKKDRSDKVSGTSNVTKNVKAAGKPNFPMNTELERSAMGKPNITIDVQKTGTVSIMDGNLSGTLIPIVQGKKDGAKRGGKERVAILEQ